MRYERTDVCRLLSTYCGNTNNMNVESNAYLICPNAVDVSINPNI